MVKIWRQQQLETETVNNFLPPTVVITFPERLRHSWSYTTDLEKAFDYHTGTLETNYRLGMLNVCIALDIDPGEVTTYGGRIMHILKFN